MGLTVYGGGGKPEEEKTVTAGTSVIEVNPSSGKVMKKVTVNPTPTESKEVTAGTSDTTVSPTEGKHLSGVTVHPTPSQEKTVIPTADGFKVNPETGKLLSAVFVDGDSDLVAENIKQGVNIFGVDGSFDNSHGAYVWKKWKIESKQVTLSFSVLNSNSPYQLKVDCDNEIALKIATASSFVGLHGIWNGTGYYEFPDANTLRIYDGSNIYNFTSVYDANTNTFSVTSATGIGNTSQFADCTHSMQAGTFEGFAVSDNESAYPDGGTQDGYWYERVVEGIVTVSGTFTPSAMIGDYSISNPFGSADKIISVLCYCENLSMAWPKVRYKNKLNDTFLTISNSGQVLTTDNITITDDKISFINEIDSKEYKWEVIGNE